MNKEIEQFLNHHRVAMLGASQTGKKIGNLIVENLEEKGYEVFLVHPTAKQINGKPCTASLVELKDKVDGAVFCIPPERGIQAVQDAADAGITRLWLQQGAESPELLAKAYASGMSVVVKKCIMMYAEPVKSIHKFHKAINKLFGQY